jgi:hypothetical protein
MQVKDATRRRVGSLPSMSALIPELTLVPDEELERLSERNGPTSAEAQVLAQLRTQRAQDLQVYAFREDDQYVTGPLPDVAEPADSEGELMEALKRARKEEA